jgi:hypothetical protein
VQTFSIASGCTPDVMEKKESEVRKREMKDNA